MPGDHGAKLGPGSSNSQTLLQAAHSVRDSQPPEFISAGAQFVSLVEEWGTNNSLVHDPMPRLLSHRESGTRLSAGCWSRKSTKVGQLRFRTRDVDGTLQDHSEPVLRRQHHRVVACKPVTASSFSWLGINQPQPEEPVLAVGRHGDAMAPMLHEGCGVGLNPRADHIGGGFDGPARAGRSL